MALNFGRPFFFVQVLYATGLSMIAMAALVWIGPRLVLVVGGAIVLLAPVAILPLLHPPGALALLRTFTERFIGGLERQNIPMKDDPGFVDGVSKHLRSVCLRRHGRFHRAYR